MYRIPDLEFLMYLIVSFAVHRLVRRAMGMDRMECLVVY